MCSVPFQYGFDNNWYPLSVKLRIQKQVLTDCLNLRFYENCHYKRTCYGNGLQQPHWVRRIP